MVDYQPRHASQNIHCTTAKPHHTRRADTIAASDALAFARHTLAEVYERLKAEGTDQGVLDASFGPALASLGQGTGRAAPSPREPGPPIPDLPGLSLRPDPGAAGTVAEFLDCLRNYRLWAGSPSFRVMSKNCERRFAPSTICTALGSDSMPSLEMALAIVAACGGPQQHQCEFATAWRRLVIPRQ